MNGHAGEMAEKEHCPAIRCLHHNASCSSSTDGHTRLHINDAQMKVKQSGVSNMWANRVPTGTLPSGIESISYLSSA
jgi:hypothetical protein